MSAHCGGAPEVILHEEVVVREGLRHLQQRDQVARLLPDLPAGAFRTVLSDAAQLQVRTAGRMMLCGATSAQCAGLCKRPFENAAQELHFVYKSHQGMRPWKRRDLVCVLLYMWQC